MDNSNIPEEYRPISMWGYFGYDPDRRLYLPYRFRNRCEERKQEEFRKILFLLHHHRMPDRNRNLCHHDGNRRSFRTVGNILSQK